jgi:hypothetical protein
MRAHWYLNLALAALVVGLALFAYFKPGADKPTGPPLTPLTTETVTQLRIERAGREPIAIEKTASGWRLSAPVHARANRFNIESLLRVVTATSEYRTPANPEELSKYGLDKPLVRLRFNSEEIAVGAMHPIKPELYLHYLDRVQLVPSYILSAAFFDYTSFIDTQLLEEERQLTALYLPALRLVRLNGVWQREPHDEKISVDRLNEFDANWQNARALSVERLSTKPMLERIQLVSEANGKRDTLALEILAYKPDFILARRDEGLEYHFPEEVGKGLLAVRREE